MLPELTVDVTEQSHIYPLTLPHVLQTDPIEFVENICENMQLFPKEDFLTGDQLMFEYEPQVSRRLGPPLISDRPLQVVSFRCVCVCVCVCSGDQRCSVPPDSRHSQPAASVSGERRCLAAPGEMVRDLLQRRGSVAFMSPLRGSQHGGALHGSAQPLFASFESVYTKKQR